MKTRVHRTAGTTRTAGKGLLSIALLACLASAGALGCFELKEPPCAFSCATPPHRCPEKYTCGEDGLCYREGADRSLCPLLPPDDAGADAADANDR